ncbi:MAG: hypothetical protein HOP30_20475 [Cyclobacteriaceae bacterium]|nr:hypothetical protein [Cyclobacteriaceae bacterium]
MRFNKYISCALLLTAFACSDSDSISTERIRLLTDNATKKWTVISVDREEPIAGIDCEADDILTLKLFDNTLAKPGASFSLSEGLIRCDFEDSYITTSGSWRLNNAQTRLIFTRIYSNGLRTNSLVDIIELQERKMVLRYREELDLKITYTTYTYESL